MGKETTQTTQQSQNSQTSPWEKAQPLLEKLLAGYTNGGTDVTSGQSAALQNLTSSASGIPNFGGQASDALGKMFGSDTSGQVGMLRDAYGQLQGNLGGTASGAELDPYKTPGFGDAIDTMTQDITNKVKGVYAGSGRSPSGAGSFAGSLGRGLTQGIAPVIQSQFNTNKTNQMNAAQQLFGAGSSTAGNITGQQQVPMQNWAQAIGLIPGMSKAYTSPAETQLAAQNTAYQQPYGNLGEVLKAALGLGGMGSQSSGSGTSTTSQPQNTMSNIMGGISGGIGLLSLLSDERAKDEIEPIGKLNDGQQVVRFRYKGQPIMRIGLLAQDVEKFEPKAVHNMGGLLAVDHRKATDRAARMGRTA